MSAKEIEIKLELPTAALSGLHDLAVLRAGAAPKRTSEVSVYFDTRNHKLRKRGLTLRVRRCGGRYVQTIKALANADIFKRGEWESEIASGEPDLARARGTALEPFLGGKFSQRLEPIFETRVKRTVYPLVRDSSAIAVAIDRGSIDTGEAEEPLCEIELELEHGNIAELFELAREIAEMLPANLTMTSKSERGYRLADGESGDAPIRFTPAQVSTGTRARDAFKAIGRACLRQIVSNEPALLKGEPEGVHQMRVGIRRLRAAISLCSELLRDPETAAIKTELKWLTAELAAARELQVLMQRVVAPAKPKRSDRNGVAALTRRFGQQRATAMARARDAVRSKRFRRLALDVAAWLETGQWTNPEDDLVRKRGDLPIETLARSQLGRRWRKVRKRRKSFASLSARRRHKLRIQAKKLRYAAEFFAGLFPGKRAAKGRKKFLVAIEDVQDAFGDLNDIAVHEKLIGAAGNGRANRNSTFAAGLLTGGEEARLDAAMTAASAALSHFAKVEPFWR